jgi:hypothetical protein
MKNGVTKILTEKQHSKLMIEYNKHRVKSDLVAKYSLPVPTIERVIQNKRCSERVFNKLFNPTQNGL